MAGDGTYASAFDALSREAPVPAAVQSKRNAAFERFSALGFPTTKNEDWHYTSVSPIAEEEFTLLTERSGDVRAEQLAPFLFGAQTLGWKLVVFVNGRFAPELSSLGGLPSGVMVESLAEAWSAKAGLTEMVGHIAASEAHTFTALNTAFMYDGAMITIARDAQVAAPIHLLYITDATAAKRMMHPRTLIQTGAHSKATIIESYVSLSNARYFTNAVSEVWMGEGASLDHYKVQREGLRAFHVGTTQVHQSRDSHYQSFSFATGAELSRTNVYTTLDGEGSGATLNGLYRLAEAQTCDHQTQIIHAQPNTYRRELYKGILDGRSHGVFNGKVYVHPIAQKTDGKQTNKTLLLSPNARVDTKPQLEIFADDVKCTHGATIGQIDRTALFYMKSRGIGAERALPLLTYAFAADVIETLPVEALRDDLERQTLERFVSR